MIADKEAGTTSVPAEARITCTFSFTIRRDAYHSEHLSVMEPAELTSNENSTQRHRGQLHGLRCLRDGLVARLLATMLSYHGTTVITRLGYRDTRLHCIINTLVIDGVGCRAPRHGLRDFLSLYRCNSAKAAISSSSSSSWNLSASLLSSAAVLSSLPVW